VKKMQVYRQKINKKKMVDTADQQGGFSGFQVEGQQDIDVEKRAEQTDDKEEKVGLRFAAAENRQNGQCYKTAQSQKWWNTVKFHHHLILVTGPWMLDT